MPFGFQKRVEKLRETLAREKVDALVLAVIESNNRNIEYLTGFSGTTGVLAVSADAVVLAVDGRYTERAQSLSGVTVVEAKGRGEQYEGFVSAAVEALKLSSEAKLGFEGDRITVLMAEAWKKRYSTLAPTRNLVEILRGVKDEREVAAIREAGVRASEAFTDVVGTIKAGMTEREFARELDIALMRRGALKPSFDTIVASGPHSAMPHHETGERKFVAGEPVVIDFGGLYPGGYCSDITRTVFVPGAEPDPEMVKIYQTVLGANHAARDAMRVGMTAREYDAAAREYLKERGYAQYFLHGLGHSIGLEVHDPYDYTRPFEAGVVMSDEPGIYIAGKGGVRIEDDLVLTAEGAEVLNPTPYLDYDPL